MAGFLIRIQAISCRMAWPDSLPTGTEGVEARLRSPEARRRKKAKPQGLGETRSGEMRSEKRRSGKGRGVIMELFCRLDMRAGV